MTSDNITLATRKSLHYLCSWHHDGRNSRNKISWHFALYVKPCMCFNFIEWGWSRWKCPALTFLLSCKIWHCCAMCHEDIKVWCPPVWFLTLRIQLTFLNFTPWSSCPLVPTSNVLFHLATPCSLCYLYKSIFLFHYLCLVNLSFTSYIPSLPLLSWPSYTFK